MKNQLSSILIAMGLLLVTISCNNESAPEMSVDSSLSKEASIEKLPSDVEDLSLSDAETVANLFNKKSATRSQQEKTIKNVIAINGKDGNPAIYAVNFNEDGYILVSATTKYYPILATVDHGEYSDDMPETGQQIVIAGMLDNIELIKSGKTKIDCSPFWGSYFQLEIPKIASRSDDGYNDYLQAYDVWSELLYENPRTRSIKKLIDMKGSLPADVYSAFVYAAQSEDLWEGTEYSWENTAYVVATEVDEGYQTGPFLSTEWGQTGTYNTSGYNALGCVTIAVGQIMRFYRYPSYYNWWGMPNRLDQIKHETNSVLSNFLSKLRGELNVDVSGSSTIYNAENVLKGYGYNVSVEDYNETKLCSYLNNYKPVYTRGRNNSDGHAWVIDGIMDATMAVHYNLYRLSDTKYPNFEYVKAENADTYKEYYDDYLLYHMNWGWNGISNGWFKDGANLIYNPEDQLDFINNRKNLYIDK